MSITTARDQAPLVAAPSPSWGELAGQADECHVLRIVVPDRTVSLPISELDFWELASGEPDILTLHSRHHDITIAGKRLEAIATALDERLLLELRTNREYRGEPDAAHVREISIERRDPRPLEPGKKIEPNPTHARPHPTSGSRHRPS